MTMKRLSSFVLVFLIVGVLQSVPASALERLRPAELLERVREARESTPPLTSHLRYTITTDYEDRPDEREYMERVVDIYFDEVNAARRLLSQRWKGQADSTPPSEQFNQEIWDGQRFYSVGWWSSEPGVRRWLGGTATEGIYAQGLRVFSSGAEMTGIFDGDIIPYYEVLTGAKKIKVQVDNKLLQDIPTYRIVATTERGKYQIWIDPARNYHIVKAIHEKGASDLAWGDLPISELERMPKESVKYTLTNIEFDTIDGLIFPVRGHVQIDSVYFGAGPGGSRSVKVTREIVVDSIELNPDFEALQAFVPDAPPNTVLTDWSNDNSQVVWTGSEVSDDEALVFEVQSLQQPIARTNFTPSADIYDDQADRRALIGSALETAHEEGKRVIIVWGANWCGWCQMLERQCQADAEIQELLDSYYVPVHVDLTNRDEHTGLALEYGLDLNTLRTPHITILNEEAKPILQKQSSSLVTFKDGSSVYSEERIARMLKEFRRVSE